MSTKKQCIFPIFDKNEPQMFSISWLDFQRSSDIALPFSRYRVYPQLTDEAKKLREVEWPR